jgi:hypothetical protein
MRNYVKVLRAALTVLLMLAAMAGVAVAGPLEDAFVCVVSPRLRDRPASLA